MIIDMQQEKCDDLLQSTITNDGKNKNQSPTSTIASNFPKASALFLNAKSKKLVNQKSSFPYRKR